MKRVIFSLMILPSILISQEFNERENEKDYKDPAQFEQFNKKRQMIGSWQINQLKDGALIVRLKTNKTLLSQLKSPADEDVYKTKLIEQYAINKNTMLAFKDNFNFCK